MSEHVTVRQIQEKKRKKEKIVVLTAYDYPLASLIDRSAVDIILVGDSLANVALGLDSTTQVGMTEMLHHAKAVRRAVKRALLVGDMPFESYQEDPSLAVANARRFVEEAGCDAVKLEWFDRCLEAAGNIVAAGIPVMGHVGLTPQTAGQMGGFKVQGKDAGSARKILENALALEKKGCFSVVLECIPAPLAAMITGRLSIPTIGIGAGKDCDGQVLVTHDLLGLFERFTPKFVKQYVRLNDSIEKGIARFCADVRRGKFPDNAHSYPMNPQELKTLKGKAT
ncbi:MAG TPA: 3-methyl-2-oxobutanoate hydroxymethyltransferase [Candidatus Omnitrophica bacterium]|nr:3-methyl-2-oxobutanoate hydroxymethyltransferase [Candidatus Omnitrophota bacterium]HCI45094.1 3-methyl-2-oxobutanoate hydroxymethyltransferase [Candidatus Omnitrophota bacterium]